MCSSVAMQHVRRPVPAAAARSPLAVTVLHARHTAALRAHLLALSDDDRRQRFGRPMNASALDGYLHAALARPDLLLGAWPVPGVPPLIGLAHLAAAGVTIEVGLSVLPAARDRGVGSALLARAIDAARRSGAARVALHCQPDNGPMLRLVRAAGLRVRHVDGQVEATLQLPRPTPALA